MLQNRLFLLCWCILSLVCLSQSWVSISDFECHQIYTGVDNTMVFTMSDYPWETFSTDQLIAFLFYIGESTARGCRIQRVWSFSDSTYQVQVHCFVPYDYFAPSSTQRVTAHVQLINKRGSMQNTGTYGGLTTISPQFADLRILPHILMMKKGMQFMQTIADRKAIVDASTMVGFLQDKPLRIQSYQSGAFLLELEEDYTELTDHLSLSQYMKEDVSHSFLSNYTIRPKTVTPLIPTTDAYITWFDSFYQFAGDASFKQFGKISGAPTSVNVLKWDGSVAGQVPVLESTEDYLVIKNDNINGMLASEMGYISLDGHEGRAYVFLIRDALTSITLTPSTCVEGQSCTISVYPALPYNLPYELSVNIAGEETLLLYTDVSIPGGDSSTQWIPKFPSNVDTSLIVKLAGRIYTTSKLPLVSIPDKNTVFSETKPLNIVFGGQRPSSTLYQYGAGQEELPDVADFEFLPSAGDTQVKLRMVKVRDINGVLSFSKTLSDDVCINAYTCYKMWKQVSPVSTQPMQRALTVSFKPNVETNLLHRVYFETSIKDVTDAMLLQFVRDLSNAATPCTSVLFSIFQMVKTTGGTWIDVSMTNSDEVCFTYLTESFSLTISKLYKLLSLTGRSTGGHPQKQCTQLPHSEFREDCTTPDKNYFIPIPPVYRPDDSPIQKINNHNYTILFTCVFVAIVGGIVAAWYFCKYKKDQMKRSKTHDVYDRMAH